MNPEQRIQPTENTTPLMPESEISFVDLATWMGRGKKRILILTVISTLLAIVIAFVLPKTYSASLSVMPPQQKGSGGAAAALAALGGDLSLTGGVGGKSNEELYVALMRSESIVRALDQRFQLRSRYHFETHKQLQLAFPSIVKAVADKKSGLISVEASDKDPQFAATLANALIEELAKILSRLSVTEAQQRLDFYEKQLKQTQENLIKADQSLQQLQEKSGVVAIDKQSEALLTSIAQIRARIAEREVQMQVLLRTLTTQHPDVQRLTIEINGLRAEMQRLERSRQNGQDSSEANTTIRELSAERIPGLAADYIRARREVKFNEALLESMLKQYEVAKLDVAKEGPSLQVVDRALPPESKSKPKRASIILMGMVLGLVLSTLWVLAREYLTLLKHTDPQTAKSWAALQQAWGFNRHKG